MNDELDKYRRDFEIIREVSVQLIKDFNIAGFSISFSGNELLAYAELKKQIEVVLTKLILEDATQFQNLLYRIDVEEKKVKLIFQKNEKEFLIAEIADLVLQREFQKVLTRRFYSGG